MTFRQFLRIIRARKLVVLASLALFVAVALALTLLLPKRYSASASVLVDFKAVDPVLGNYMPAQAVPGYVATQVDIIQSRAVALKVVKALRLSDNAAIHQQYLDDTGGRGQMQDWLADLLLKKLDVRPSRESSVVEISYSSPDPKFAAAMANAFAQAYIEENLDLKMFPAQKTAIWFDKQKAELRSNLEQAQAKVLQYQKDKGIVAVDERLDVETTRLSELTNELVRAQAAAYDYQSRADQLSEFLAQNKNPESLPEVLASPLINSLKSQLALSEAKLNQLGAQLGHGHPEYQRVEAEVEGSKRKLTEEIKAVYTGINNSARVAQAREAEQRAAVQRQKARLLELNRGRDEMTVLVKDLENAQRAFEAAGSRYTQSTLEGRNDQVNISILSPAAEPTRASFPRLGLNLMIGVLFGVFFGVSLAVFMEMFDRRVRSAQDLSEVLQIPALGMLRDSHEKPSWWARRKRWAWEPHPATGHIGTRP